MPRNKVILPLYTGAYKSDSPWLGSFGCLNMYPEPIKGEVGASVGAYGIRGFTSNSAQEGTGPQGGPNTIALIGTPGTKLLAAVGAGPHRGAIEHIGNMYVVSGNQLIKVDTSYNTTTLGTIGTSQGTVSMSSNGDIGGQITIVDGNACYVWDSNALTLTHIVANVIVNPIKTLFLEGYTVLIANGTNQWQISNFYDSATYSALMTAVAEFDPGANMAVAKTNRQLFFIGEQLTEIWYNSGNDFPFDHVPNGLIEWGTVARDSVVNVGDNSLMWLGRNKQGQNQVVQSSGFQAQSVTPRTLLSVWRKYSRVDDATAFCYQEHGHVFYQITFPAANKTWCYDVSTGMWHERASYDNTNTLGRHRAATYLFFNGIHIVGDYDTGSIYQLDMDTFTDNGNPILRQLITYHITDKREQVKHNFVELEGESGVGLLSGQGSDPVISIEISDDGGHTYGNVRTAKYGMQGQYERVVRWPWLGSSRNRVYRISMSDPIKWRLFRMVLDYNEGII